MRHLLVSIISLILFALSANPVLADEESDCPTNQSVQKTFEAWGTTTTTRAVQTGPDLEGVNGLNTVPDANAYISLTTRGFDTYTRGSPTDGASVCKTIFVLNGDPITEEIFAMLAVIDRSRWNTVVVSTDDDLIIWMLWPNSKSTEPYIDKHTPLGYGVYTVIKFK